MPQKYRVALSDGRSFDVETEGGAPSEADIMQQLASQETTPQPERGPLARFAEAFLPSTTPSDYIKGPMYAVRHPIESASLIGEAVAKNPVGAIPVVGQLKRAYDKGMAGNYAGAAGELTSAATPLIMRGVRVPTGKGLDIAGLALEKAGESQAAKAASGYGLAGELIKGNWKSAAGVALGPQGAKLTGRLMQAGGRAMSGLANDKGLVSELFDASTKANGIALNPWENTFLTSIDSQLNSGGALTPGQTSALRSLYLRKLGQ